MTNFTLKQNGFLTAMVVTISLVSLLAVSTVSAKGHVRQNAIVDTDAYTSQVSAKLREAGLQPDVNSEYGVLPASSYMKPVRAQAANRYSPLPGRESFAAARKLKMDPAVAATNKIAANEGYGPMPASDKREGYGPMPVCQNPLDSQNKTKDPAKEDLKDSTYAQLPPEGADNYAELPPSMGSSVDDEVTVNQETVVKDLTGVERPDGYMGVSGLTKKIALAVDNASPPVGATGTASEYIEAPALAAKFPEFSVSLPTPEVTGEGTSKPRTEPLKARKMIKRAKHIFPSWMEVSGRKVDVHLYRGITDYEISQLIRVMQRKRIHTLNLSNTQNGDAILRALKNANIHGLRELTMYNSGVTDEGLQTIAASQRRLRVLELGQNALTGVGGVHLRKLTHLRKLGLRWNALDTYAALRIATLRHLTELNLFGNRIGVVGATHLIKALQSREGHKLDLRRNMLRNQKVFNHIRESSWVEATFDPLTKKNYRPRLISVR